MQQATGNSGATEDRATAGSAQAVKWDAFISYASSDRSTARRLQQFLERYRHPDRGRRLKVFLDVTDIRSGELGRSLGEELKNSRKLVVCASPASADSRWVDKEFAIFRGARDDGAVGVVLLDGEPDQVVPPAADGGTYRWHDLRRSFGGWLFGRRRLELLRLLAFVADMDLRKIVNWQRRRIAARLAVVLPLVGGTGTAVALYPVSTWQPLPLGEADFPRGPVVPIACELQNPDRLWAAARVRQDYALGPRNYIVQFPNARAARPEKIDTWVVGRPVAPYRLQSRLLPLSLVDEALRREAERALAGAAPNDRATSGEPFAVRLHSGVTIAVQRLDETQAERDGFQNMDEHRAPLPGWGALVVISIGEQRRISVVPGLIPKWEPFVPRNDPVDPRNVPSSPYRGLSVAATGPDRYWLGVGAWDSRSPGGLWQTSDGGSSWQTDGDFGSINGLTIVADTDARRIVAAQSGYEDQWRSIVVIPHAPQLVQRSLDANVWRKLTPPQHGAQSEFEVCGVLGGSLFLRVDRTIYFEASVPLWQSIRDGGFR